MLIWCDSRADGIVRMEEEKKRLLLCVPEFFRDAFSFQWTARKEDVFMKQSSKTIRLAQMAMLAAISVILVAFVRIPLVPAAPFLVYDMADAPVLIGTLLFGSVPGLTILLVVSVIQAFMFSSDGWVGLLMHFVASGALVVLTGSFYHHKKRMRDAIIGMVLGSLAMTLIMIPMNYIFTVHVYGTPKEVVDAILLPGIIPFNLIKSGANSLLAGILFKLLSPFVHRNKTIIGQS